MTAVTFNSQSMLAKLLATENITVQHTPGIKTAMFDLKNRVLMLPVWEDISTDLKHLLIGHETGHALDTPDAETYAKAIDTISSNVFGDKLTDSLKKTVRGFLNVIEDVRIDKRQKRRYPGLRKNYLLGYKELIDRDFFGTKNRDINSMNFIDRLNLYFKGGSIHYNIQFTPAERSLLKRVENAETFAECIEITEEVYRYCKNKLENDKFDDDLIISVPSDEDDQEDWDDDYSDIYSDGDEDSDEDSEEDSDGDSDGDSEDADTDGKSSPKERGEGDIQSDGGNQGKSGAGNQDELDKNAPESMTDKTWEDKIQSLVRDDNCQYTYLSMPDIDWKVAVDDYKKVLNDWRNSVKNGYWSLTTEEINYARQRVMEWRMKEKDAISFLVKEFEQRKSAEIYSRISVAKTGVIDTNKLHSYKYNDDIFRRLSVIPEGKNHGFVMFLDWSGSMDSCLKETMKQLLTLVLFCKQIQVPFDVYTFKDSGAGYPWLYDGKENALGLNNVVLRQVLSSKMNITELNDAFAFLWHMSHGGRLMTDCMGGTPLNDALILAPKIVNDFRAKYKLEIVNVIVMTDGESNGFSGVKNETNPENPYVAMSRFNAKKRRYLYNDPETGKTFDLTPYGWSEGTTSNTNVLLTLLKEKTGCNLIGFYLWSESWHRFLNRFNIHGNPDYHRSVSKFWKDHKFYPVKSAGYDDYYVIDVKALRNTANDLTIDKTKSTRQMAKAFSKFAANKTTNRVLLKQFIEHVTNQAKKIA